MHETESDIALNEFKTYHPIVNFAYFIFVFIFAMWFMNPVNLCISLCCGFIYLIILKGKKYALKSMLYMLPVIVTTSLINAAFNHRGVSILTYLPGGNPLTLESIVYGFFASLMLVSVMAYFFCYNELMTSDKFIYLFGKLIPSLSLIISMTLRFVPRFTAHLKETAQAQKLVQTEPKGIIQKIKSALSVLSSAITWALENSVETTDSMKARGYGLPGRSGFSIFKFDKRDFFILITIVCLGIYVITGKLNGEIDFSYFPAIRGNKLSAYGISIYTSHFMLCILPVIIEIREVIKWKVLKSKI